MQSRDFLHKGEIIFCEYEIFCASTRFFCDGEIFFCECEIFFCEYKIFCEYEIFFFASTRFWLRDDTFGPPCILRHWLADETYTITYGFLGCSQLEIDHTNEHYLHKCKLQFGSLVIKSSALSSNWKGKCHRSPGQYMNRLAWRSVRVTLTSVGRHNNSVFLVWDSSKKNDVRQEKRHSGHGPLVLRPTAKVKPSFVHVGLIVTIGQILDVSGILMCHDWSNSWLPWDVSGLVKLLTSLKCFRIGQTLDVVEMFQDWSNCWRRWDVSGLVKLLTSLECVRIGQTLDVVEMFQDWSNSWRRWDVSGLVKLLTSLKCSRIGQTLDVAGMCQDWSNSWRRWNVPGLVKLLTSLGCVRIGQTLDVAGMCQDWSNSWRRWDVSGLVKLLTSLECVRIGQTECGEWCGLLYWKMVCCILNTTFWCQ